tara:strand:- start:3310 stop:3834 length:525 start_codon:yes stop_codon:yes gene_type:complete
MVDNILDEISNLIEYEERDLKFRLGDDFPITFTTTPSIAYDYLNINDDLDYSFHNPEFLKMESEEFPNKSDYNIYFDKIKNLCKKSLDESLNNSSHKEHLKTVNPNKNLVNVVKKIFKKNHIPPEQLPQFGEFGLYTNKKSNRAPRVFFFIGNAGMIYILFYDPFHKIFPSKTL